MSYLVRFKAAEPDASFRLQNLAPRMSLQRGFLFGRDPCASKKESHNACGARDSFQTGFMLGRLPGT